MSQMIVLDTHLWFWLATQDWTSFRRQQLGESRMSHSQRLENILLDVIVKGLSRYALAARHKPTLLR